MAPALPDKGKPEQFDCSGHLTRGYSRKTGAQTAISRFVTLTAAGGGIDSPLSSRSST
jgi:hypothetical protein